VNKNKLLKLKIAKLVEVLEKKAADKQQNQAAIWIQKYFRSYAAQKHFKNVCHLRILAAEVRLRNYFSNSLLFRLSRSSGIVIIQI